MASAAETTRGSGIIIFAAEPATERGAADAYAVDGQAEQRRHLVAGHERGLRRGAHDQLALDVEPSGGGLRLEVALVDPRRVEAAADDDLAGGERGVDIAARQAGGAEHVLGQLLLVADPAGGNRGVGVAEVAVVTLVGGMEPGARRAGPDGALHIDDGLDALELELDQLDRVRGQRFGLRDRDRDRLPGVHDLLAGERILGPARAGGDDREVVGGEHGDDAGQLTGGGHVDRLDQRVGVVGEQEASVQEPVDGYVGSETGVAANLRLGVATGSGGADRRLTTGRGSIGSGHDPNLSSAPELSSPRPER